MVFHAMETFCAIFPRYGKYFSTLWNSRVASSSQQVLSERGFYSGRSFPDERVRFCERSGKPGWERLFSAGSGLLVLGCWAEHAVPHINLHISLLWRKIFLRHR